MQLDTKKMLASTEDGIGWVTFNNPERRNAVSLEMWQGLGVILEHFQQDDEVRVVVMRGAGDKSFVSGADISEFEKRRGNAEAAEEYGAVSSDARRRLSTLDKPLLAMIKGYCIGGGLAIALSADIRIASEGSKFGIPAARLGLGYGYNAVKGLIDLVGPAMAKDILFTARHLDTEEALRIGLINRVVAPDMLESEVRKYAASICENAPLTIKSVKAAAREAMRPEAKRDVASVEKLVQECFDSQDYAEGRRAFMEKRKPVFKGR